MGPAKSSQQPPATTLPVPGSMKKEEGLEATTACTVTDDNKIEAFSNLNIIVKLNSSEHKEG